MRFEQWNGGQPSGIRHAENAHAPVVVLDVLDQPADRVVSVRSLVNRLGIVLVARRTIHSEIAFGSKFPANVLKSEDVTVRDQLFVSEGQPAGHSGSSPVWRPVSEYRRFSPGVLRQTDARVKVDAVTHRDHRFNGLEFYLCGVWWLLYGLRLAERGDQGQERRRQNDVMELRSFHMPYAMRHMPYFIWHMAYGFATSSVST